MIVLNLEEAKRARRLKQLKTMMAAILIVVGIVSGVVVLAVAGEILTGLGLGLLKFALDVAIGVSIFATVVKITERLVDEHMPSWIPGRS